jgi:hypothetical protein
MALKASKAIAEGLRFFCRINPKICFGQLTEVLPPPDFRGGKLPSIMAPVMGPFGS